MTFRVFNPRLEGDILRDAWVEFLSRWMWDWFVTLTFKNAIHPEAADKLFRVWISKINRRLYGVRWYQREESIRWVRALEMQRRDVLHYHALVGGPRVDELRRLSWMDEWHSLTGCKVRHVPGHPCGDGASARIEVPQGDMAVIAYCSKYVIKGGQIDLGGPLNGEEVAAWLRRIRESIA